jgi:hypothetical protein
MNVAHEPEVSMAEQQKGGSMYNSSAWRAMRNASCLSGLFLAALMALGTRALAQFPSASLSQPPGSAYYARGQLRSSVTCSFLANPAIFELLSAADGPTEDASFRSVVLIRALDQKWTSTNGQAMLASGQAVRLAPSDAAIVPSTTRHQVRGWLSIAATASVLSSLTLTIVNRVGA